MAGFESGWLGKVVCEISLTFSDSRLTANLVFRDDKVWFFATDWPVLDEELDVLATSDVREVDGDLWLSCSGVESLLKNTCFSKTDHGNWLFRHWAAFVSVADILANF